MLLKMIYELMSITRNGEVTMSSILLFCRYPQAFFQQLSIIDLRVAGESYTLFSDTLYNGYATLENKEDERVASKVEQLLIFLDEPRSRKEITQFLGLSTINYAMKTFIQPLLDVGKVRMTDPSNPRSHNQRYVRVKTVMGN